MTDATLLENFMRGKILNADFTHEVHLRIAFLYVKNSEFWGAFNRLKKDIQNLNRENQVTNSLKRGYHETLTYAWLHLVKACCGSHDYKNSDEFLQNNPQLLNSRFLNSYYSEDYLFSAAAKNQIVAPDLKALPECDAIASPDRCG